MSALDAVLAQADAQIDQSLERLKALIRLKSISTDPAFAPEVRKGAEWLREELTALGFMASVRETPGHPVVVGHDLTASGPHVLFYGHYDVQPVDPLSLWHTDPFEAVLKPTDDGDTLIVARGASDDKGQLLTFIEACRAWKAVHGALPLKVSMMLEGEEESGSKNLAGFMRSAADELGAADVALVCDTDMWNPETPSIVTSLRGLVGEQVTITCASHDLHSGMYGNAARNPIQVLAEIIASLRTPDGGVAVDGFYDGVDELPADVAALWKRLPYDEAGFLRGAGLTSAAGEKGRSVLEQTRARPTCEINGISGGYEGDGFKTVIPAKAMAKISFRLVGRQDPQACAGPSAAGREGGIRGAWRQPGRVGADRWAVRRQSRGRSGSRVGGGDGARRLWRLDPRGRRVQEAARPRHAADRLCAGRRPHSLAQREIQSAELSEGHPLVGADHRGIRRQGLN
jgi:acetylornithine deacetylase/succinyl-diaminopimelate desuccinylase-like protein